MTDATLCTCASMYMLLQERHGDPCDRHSCFYLEWQRLAPNYSTLWELGSIHSCKP